MPLYEYRCTKCGHEFDQLMPNSDAPNPSCPCEEDGEPCGQTTERLVSRSSFHLKGGGWAAEGY